MASSLDDAVPCLPGTRWTAMTWGLGLDWKAAGSSSQSATPLHQASLSSSPSPAIAPPVHEPCQACLRNQPGAREYWMNRRLHLKLNCWPRLPFRPFHLHTATLSRDPISLSKRRLFFLRARDTFARDNHCSHSLLMEDGPLPMETPVMRIQNQATLPRLSQRQFNRPWPLIPLSGVCLALSVW